MLFKSKHIFKLPFFERLLSFVKGLLLTVEKLYYKLYICRSIVLWYALLGLAVEKGGNWLVEETRNPSYLPPPKGETKCQK